MGIVESEEHKQRNSKNEKMFVFFGFGYVPFAFDAVNEVQHTIQKSCL